MGGYTGPVIYHGISLDELNFSQNPAAAACVLSHGTNISILTGNNTLEPSYLPREEFLELVRPDSFIAQKCGYRFDDQGNRYAPPYESGPDTNRILVRSYRVNPWTSVHELVIWDLDAPDARWMELHYDRSGRNHTLRIDLTGGQDA